MYYVDKYEITVRLLITQIICSHLPAIFWNIFMHLYTDCKTLWKISELFGGLSPFPYFIYFSILLKNLDLHVCYCKNRKYYVLILYIWIPCMFEGIGSLPFLIILFPNSLFCLFSQWSSLSFLFYFILFMVIIFDWWDVTFLLLNVLCNILNKINLSKIPI